MLKLSGEALQGGMGFGIDPKVLKKVAREVASASKQGIQVSHALQSAIWSHFMPLACDRYISKDKSPMDKNWKHCKYVLSIPQSAGHVFCLRVSGSSGTLALVLLGLVGFALSGFQIKSCTCGSVYPPNSDIHRQLE